MAKHKKYDLLDIIVQSINDSGWNVLYIGDVSDHPFLLKIYNAEESYLVRIYVWNITPGGKTRPNDEFAIQKTSVKSFERGKTEKTLILGWWREGEVFAGWDFNQYKNKIYRPKSSNSSQIKEENLRKASINGFSPYKSKTQAIAVAFRPDFFINYVQNLEVLHSFDDSAKDYRLLEEISDQPLEINKSLIKRISKKRRISVYHVTKKLREANFQARVLTAYGFRCAFSGMQLKLVDAAHILPVSYDKSTDDTANGIALSALYHRAYDKGLVTFTEKYQIIVNDEKLGVLKEIGFDGGMERFVKDLRPVIHVPPATSDRPHVDFVNQANKLRGWK